MTATDVSVRTNRVLNKHTTKSIKKRCKNPSIKTSKTNLNNKNINEYLRSWSPTIRTHKQGNIPSINSSNTNMAKDDKYQQEVNAETI